MKKKDNRIRGKKKEDPLSIAKLRLFKEHPADKKRKQNPNSLKNLKMFEKGKSGNPLGRPRNIPQLDVLLANILGNKEGDGEESSAAYEIIAALTRRAKRGNIRAANALLDRLYGRAKNTHVVKMEGVKKEDVAGLFPFAKPKS